MAKAGTPGYELPEAVTYPDEMIHLTVWYADLRNRTPQGFGHHQPISLSEIEVYDRFLAKIGIEMEPFDFDMLCRLDGVWMTAQNTAVVKTENDEPAPVRPAGERPAGR